MKRIIPLSDPSEFSEQASTDHAADLNLDRKTACTAALGGCVTLKPLLDESLTSEPCLECTPHIGHAKIAIPCNFLGLSETSMLVTTAA